MKLLYISLFSLMVLGLVLGIVRFHGQWQNKHIDPAILQRRLSLKLYLKENGDDPKSLNWLTVYQDRKGQLRVQQPLEPTLDEVLDKYTNQKIVFNIISNVENIDLTFSQILRKKIENGQLNPSWIIIQSEYENILKSIRKTIPEALYGSSQADRMRLVIYQSLGILPAVSFKGDFYIAHTANTSDQSSSKASLPVSLISYISRGNDIEFLTPEIRFELLNRGVEIIIP